MLPESRCPGGRQAARDNPRQQSDDRQRSRFASASIARPHSQHKQISLQRNTDGAGNPRRWTGCTSLASSAPALRTMPFQKKYATVQLDRGCFSLSTFAYCSGQEWGMAIWQKLSLRARLNMLLALVMVLGLAVNIARLLLEAGPRVAAEDQSVVRLARGFVETLVSDINETPNPEARLDQIVEGLKQLRHVSITREQTASTTPAAPAPPGTSGEPRQVPEWFVTLIHPEQTTVGVPIAVNGRSLGSLVI